MFKGYVSYLIIQIVIIFVSIVFFTYLKSEKDVIKRKYRDIDCQSMKNSFSNNMEFSPMDLLMRTKS